MTRFNALRASTTMALLALMAHRSLAAQAPATKDCSRLLASSTKDSVTLRVLLQVHASDRAHDLPGWFQEDVANAVRATLHIPQPLAISTYETDWDRPPRTAHPVLRSLLRAVVTRDGRIREVRVTGGVRNEALDGALLAALRHADSTGVLKTESSEAMQDDETPIVISLSTSVPPALGEPARLFKRESGIVVSTVPFGKAPEPPALDSEDSLPNFPLFAVRTPLLSVTRSSQPLPGFGMLRYPDHLRGQENGFVSMALVVGVDGRVEEGTAIALTATRREFVQAVLNALPEFRFRALEVEGCSVRSLERMPFTFLTGQ